VSPMTNAAAPRAKNDPLGRVAPAEIEELLFDLIRTPSHEEAPGREAGLVRLLRDYLQAERVEVDLSEVLDGRHNLVARLKGDGEGERSSLLLNAHSDTVPACGMADAFEPRIKDDRIRGRGSCDVKGAIAAMAAALVGLRRSGVHLAGDLIFAATLGEETYSPGADHLVRSGLRADYAIVAEPTGMEIGIAHKGVLWLEARFKGRSVHGSVPEKGVNAIHKAARWIEEVRRRYIPALRARHDPVLGYPTVNIGTIRGGTRPVIVPGECNVGFERRLVPGETEESVLAELRDLTSEISREDPQMGAFIEAMPVFGGVYHGPLETQPESPLTEALRAGYEQEFGREPRLLGLQFWTDAALLAHMPGIRSVVVCGPGEIVQAHSDEEYLTRQQLHAAHRIYTRAALALCGTG
jgi:acetylornithine deacetylase/succinyl-diaminopimelate desuccinylase family protein